MPEKVLIVDDDVETLRLVGLMLQRQGYQIVAANNGGQAITMTRSEKPDLIVLDVMMPDIDGFEVTRQLRKDPETSQIPILMFTAKNQVEDKVAGYEVGVDDYLTKPVHPAELIAHVKSLLSRGKARAPAVEVGYMIGVIAPKGGLGVSSFVLNLAIAIHQSTKIEVIAAELRPGSGSWAFDLGFNDVDALSKLLKNHAKDITASSVEKELIQSKYGIRLLPSSTNIMDVELTRATEQMEAIAGFLPQLAPLVLLDIGANMLPNVDRVLKMCKEIIVITEPYPGTINLTKRLLEQLSGIGIGKTNIISAIVVNRTRADMQLTVPQIQEILGMPIIHLIPPAPELAYQASMNNVPLSQFQPGGLIAQQFTRLAEIIIQHVKT